MEPIPETRRALSALAVGASEEFEPGLRAWVGQAVAIVPDLVGISFTLVREGITLTFQATPEDIARVDAAQYVDDGPCVRAAAEGEARVTEHDLLDEGQWQLFAEASAMAGIRSTLSLPIMGGDVVTGGINLYGPDQHTFDGRVSQLAAALGAWEPGAVSNADLSFSSRRQAVATPQRLEERAVVDQAVGILSARQRVPVEQARERLHQAAAQAGIEPLALATLIRDDLNR